MFEDFKKVNKWALDTRLSDQKIFKFEHNGHTYYLDNYRIYGVVSRLAFVECQNLDNEALEKRSKSYLSAECNDCIETGMTKTINYIKKKVVIRILKDSDGNEIGIRDDFFKILPNVYSLKHSKEHKCVVVYDSMNIPIAVFMEVQLRK